MVFDSLLAFWRKHKPYTTIAKLGDTTLRDSRETAEVIRVDELAVKLQGAQYDQIISGVELMQSMELFDEFLGSKHKKEEEPK